MSVVGWIFGILLIGFLTFVWLQVKAAGKAAERVKQDEQDLEAAARIGQVVVDAPTDKRGVIGRLLDKSASL